MSLKTRLLGFVPLAGLDDLHTALSAVPGPTVRVRRGPGTFPGGGLAALLQDEPRAPLFRRGRETLLSSLRTVQIRLEIACQAGPFLAMDPAAACCPESAIDRVLAPAWDGLAAGLARHGDCHQWDVSVRWPPEPVVLRARADIAAAAAGGGAAGLAEAVAAALRAERDRREAAVTAALAPVVLAFAAGGAAAAESEITLTVLVAAAASAAVEAALEGMAPEPAAEITIDLRGPLPPLSFCPVRLASTEPGDILGAWRQLDLPARITRASLHQHWRRAAAAAHPDRFAGADDALDRAGADAGVADLTDAYRLLRDLLPPEASDGLTPRDLLGRAGHRLVLPDRAGPSRAPAAEPEMVA